MIQWSPSLTIPHRQSIAVLIEMVRCQHPDKEPKGSYAGAPNKNHSGRSVAKLPNGHKSDDIDHWNHAEPETNNDQRKILATQEFLQPEAQLWSTIFASAGCYQTTILWEILLNITSKQLAEKLSDGWSQQWRSYCSKAARAQKLQISDFKLIQLAMKVVKLYNRHRKAIFLAELMELYQRANQAETEYQEWLAWLMRQVGQEQDTSSQTLEKSSSWVNVTFNY